MRFGERLYRCYNSFINTNKQHELAGVGRGRVKWKRRAERGVGEWGPEWGWAWEGCAERGRVREGESGGGEGGGRAAGGGAEWGGGP